MSLLDIVSCKGGVPLGRPRANGIESEELNISPHLFYASKLSSFGNYSYALTISPKGTPRMKNKTVKQQYEMLCHFLKTTFVDCSYIFFFELYSCGEYIHCHGSIKIDRVAQVPKLKQSMYMYFMLTVLEKRKSYKPLIDLDKVNIKESWDKYCLKDLTVMLINNMAPTFKIVDTNI